ncbi:MAG: carboxypeptidase regulatory-like domain-containing protein [bacterium]|nr:carboxypeptidase regulatory-like domain-containing protein [bacterium]
MNWPYRSFAVALLLLVVFAVGCGGPPKGEVEGVVTFKGKPVSTASIIFLDLTSGQAGNANLQDDGSFKLSKPLLVGEYKVYFAPKTVEDADPFAEPEGVSMSGDGSIPAEYWNEASTTISRAVEQGENKYEIEVGSNDTI